jgi:hypothetical protein
MDALRRSIEEERRPPAPSMAKAERPAAAAKKTAAKKAPAKKAPAKATRKKA